jgi:hypothetical protein
MTSPYRALLAELLLFSEEAGEICMNESLWPKSDPNCTLLDRARALLAQPVAEGQRMRSWMLLFMGSSLRMTGITTRRWNVVWPAPLSPAMADPLPTPLRLDCAPFRSYPDY